MSIAVTVTFKFSNGHHSHKVLHVMNFIHCLIKSTNSNVVNVPYAFAFMKIK